MRSIVFFVIVFTVSFSTFAQIKTTGLPYIKGYDKLKYGAGTQSWDIAQDTNGMMYFANNDGVLQFDGENWRTYPLANNSIVRSILISDNDKLFASGFNEFGYFDISSRGDMQYVSLINKLPEAHKDVGEIWRIHQLPMGILFQSFNYLLLYADNEISILATAQDFGFSFVVDDRFFIQDRNEGLKELRGKRLFLLPEGDIFTGDNEVWSMHTYGDGNILIGTQQHGLYIFDGYAVSEFQCEASEMLKEKQIFSSARLDNRHYAYGTIQDGMIVINDEGTILQHLNQERGLRNNTILNIFQDQNQQLWLALDNGINYVELFSPFTYISSGMDVEGAGYDAVLFEDKLYLATNQGLFYKSYRDNKDEPFQIIPEIKGQVWSLHVVDETLLVAHNRGAYSIRNGEVRQIASDEGVWRFLTLQNKESQILAGTYNGLVVYERDNLSWAKSHKIRNFSESSRVLEQDDDGNVWISHGYKGIYRVEISDDFTNADNVTFFDQSDGLPSNLDNYVYKLNGEIVFGTSKGLYSFDAQDQMFYPHKKWQEKFGENKNVRFPRHDNEQNIWYGVEEYPMLLKKTDTGYRKVDSLFNRLGDCLVGGFENMVSLSRDEKIICSETGFVHYSSEYKFPEYHPYRTLIRKVTSKTKSDTVLFLGHQPGNFSSPELKYNMNDLVFLMGATIYGQDTRIQYKTLLEGYDEQWSAFQQNNIKEYTNLPPGDYVFRVKARDEERHQVSGDSYAFTILPPWYRTTIAYIFYALAFIILVFVLIRYLAHRMKTEKRKLKEKQDAELKRKEEKFRQENLLAEQKIIKLKNEKLRAEVEKKRADMELKSKEVVSIAMQMTHKNEILSQIKQNLTTVSQKVNDHASGEIRKLIHTINSDVKMDGDWERFQKHFEDVHSDFFKKLRSQYPELTPKDLRMCAYLRMNLSTKEIALISNISVRGVEISRYRLRKKLRLEKDVNLVDFMMNL